MSCNGVEIYMGFLPKYKPRLEWKMDDLFELIGRTFHEEKLYEMLEVSGEDEEGVDVLAPMIKYYLK
jgi:hypothetical protein